MNRTRIRLTLALVAAALLPATGLSQETKREAPKEHAPAAEAQKPDAPAANPREVAKKAAHFEKVHRDRIARIDRLIVVFKQKGDSAKVTELEALRAAQLKRHENGMAGFRKQLGNEHFAKLEKELKGPSARAREMRNERANENEREHDARKGEKDGKPEKEGKPDKDGKPEKEGKAGEKPAHEKSDAPKQEPPHKDKPGGKGGKE